MQQRLEPYQHSGRISLELIDVDQLADGLSFYQSRIPLLETLQGECLCEYFLDEDALLSYLQSG
jgi:hypothetical protein